MKIAGQVGAANVAVPVLVIESVRLVNGRCETNHRGKEGMSHARDPLSGLSAGTREAETARQFASYEDFSAWIDQSLNDVEQAFRGFWTRHSLLMELVAELVSRR